jgi:hypothetical protein
MFVAFTGALAGYAFLMRHELRRAARTETPA